MAKSIEKIDFVRVENIKDCQEDFELQNIYITSSKSAYAEFTIPQDGFVKIVTKANTIRQYAEGVTTYLGASTILYRNKNFIQPVGKEVMAGPDQVSETEAVALEKGTYYIQFKISDAVEELGIYGMLQTAVLYQDCSSNESESISTLHKRNQITLDKALSGFISDISPVDYYEFTVSRRTPVKIGYWTNQEGTTQIELFDTSNNKIADGSFTGGMEWFEVEKYVEKGTYYFKISSTARGKSEVRVMKQKYDLTLSYKKPIIYVNTKTEYKEIRYLKGNFYTTDVAATAWDNGTVLGKGKNSFAVNKAGYYTVRITDYTGKMFQTAIYVSDVDNVKPKAPVVSYCKAGQYYVKGKAEAGATVYLKINNSSHLYSAKASSKGVYKVKINYYLFKGDVIQVYAVDKAGNKGRTCKVIIK